MLHGYDFRAELCGVGSLEERPFMYFPDPYTIDFSLCVRECPLYFVREYFCIYNEDHVTLRFDLPCYDTFPSTRFGVYCLPFTETARENVIDWLYTF